MATEAEMTQSDAAGADQGAGDQTDTGAQSGADQAAEGADKIEQGPWGDDWRQKIAGDDPKELKRLERMQSPQDLWKSFRSIETEFHNRKTVDLPESPSDEQIAAYREANGIPNEIAGYYENMPEGLVVGEEDRPITDVIMGKLHEKNVKPEVAHELLGWYYNELEERQAALAEEDKAAERAATDELRTEWGAEYRANMNAVESLLATAPGEIGAALQGARLGDGSPLMANADAVRWLNHLSREMNPAGTVVPGGMSSQVDSLEAKATEFQKMMRENPAEYARRRGEYTQVLEALQKVKGRNAA